MKPCCLCDNVEKQGRAREATDDNTAHAHCMLDDQGYIHTLRICNTYCFFAAITATRTHLNIPLHTHCLSCFPVRFHNRIVSVVSNVGKVMDDKFGMIKIVQGGIAETTDINPRSPGAFSNYSHFLYSKFFQA